MSKSATPYGAPAAITFAVFCVVVIAASAIRLAADLNGRLGFVFFLLVTVAPVLIAMGVAVTVWRLTLRLPSYFGVLERMLLAFAGFVVTCGSSPLAISVAVRAITRHNDPVGAAGIWALMSMATALVLSVFAGAVAMVRRVTSGHRLSVERHPEAARSQEESSPPKF